MNVTQSLSEEFVFGKLGELINLTLSLVGFNRAIEDEKVLNLKLLITFVFQCLKALAK